MYAQVFYIFDRWKCSANVFKHESSKLAAAVPSVALTVQVQGTYGTSVVIAMNQSTSTAH
jgi:uncharacterized protein YhbP (UPF0306 family)